jgi:hypothetical protein
MSSGYLTRDMSSISRAAAAATTPAKSGGLNVDVMADAVFNTMEKLLLLKLTLVSECPKRWRSVPRVCPRIATELNEASELFKHLA